jgi:hypothetical protein
MVSHVVSSLSTQSTCLPACPCPPPCTGSVICKRAEQLNAVAIVVAKHNRSGVVEFFVGSCANYLTHHSKSPVVVMHCD